MRLITYVERKLFSIFLVGLFLLKIPPFYIIPPLPSQLLTTHVISRIIFIFSLAWITFVTKSKEKDRFLDILRRERVFVSIFVLLFIVMSAGVFIASNTFEFLFRYKEVFLGMIMFFFGVFWGDRLQEIAKVLFYTVIFSVSYQLVIYLFPEFYKTIFSYLINDKHYQLVAENIDRGRIYIETFDEAILPIVLWWITKNYKDYKKSAYSVVIFSLTVITSFLSNFRSRIAMLVVVLLGFGLRYKHVVRNLKGTVIGIGLIIILAVGADFLSLETLGFSYFDRLTFGDQVEDVSTVDFRVQQMRKAWDHSFVNYGLGVGLGNYFEGESAFGDYVSSLQRSEVLTRGAAEYVHSIIGTVLSENGLIGAVLFLVLMVIMLKDDVLIFSKNEKARVLTISFWSLFMYAMLNPFVPLVLQGLFWFLRGLIVYEKQT